MTACNLLEPVKLQLITGKTNNQLAEWPIYNYFSKLLENALALDFLIMICILANLWTDRSNYIIQVNCKQWIVVESAALPLVTLPLLPGGGDSSDLTLYNFSGQVKLLLIKEYQLSLIDGQLSVHGL